MPSIAETLLELQLITEDDLAEARDRRDTVGGRVEEHLYRLGALTEVQYCRALERHFGRPAVVLNGLTPDPETLARIPALVATTSTVLPVGWEDDSRKLTVACVDPSDVTLLERLSSAVDADEIELVGAVPTVLRCRVLDCYRVIASVAPEPAKEDRAENARISAARENGNVLILGSINTANQLLASVFSTEGHRVVIVDSMQEALREIDEELPDAVIIRGHRNEEHDALVDRLRVAAPSCKIRFIRTLSELAFSEPTASGAAQLLSTNLSLCVALLGCDDEGDNSADAGRRGSYVDAICRRLGLSVGDRLLVVNAAWLHELARLYLGETDTDEFIEALNNLGQTAGHAADWPPEIPAILRSRDRSLEGLYPDRLPLSILGGNILRIVEDYLGRPDAREPMTLARYETLKQEFRGNGRNRYLSRVTDAFMSLLLREVTLDNDPTQSLALVYNERGEDYLMLGPCLENLGFRTSSAEDVDDFVRRYENEWPEFLIVLAPGGVEATEELLKDLTDAGVMVRSIPTFVLAPGEVVGRLSFLLKEGVEDVLSIDADLDPLLVKINRIRSRNEDEYRRRLNDLQQIGTHGTLEDMNVIDILQAMGRTEKTICISITAMSEHLIVYLDQGNLVYAEVGEIKGPEAVYYAVGWKNGIWSVDPVRREELPSSNIDRTIDSILIEGCQRLDEGHRGDTEANLDALDEMLSDEAQ